MTFHSNSSPLNFEIKLVGTIYFNNIQKVTVSSGNWDERFVVEISVKNWPT
jgi:hypothetical protein